METVRTVLDQIGDILREDMNAVNLTEDTSYTPYSERPETYIVPVLFAIIFLVGVLGNGTLVLIFARHKNMRSVPNTYILSLALGDLLVIICGVPFTSTLYTLESWPYGPHICKLSEATRDISIGVSVFTLTALSAERYCAIVNPIRSHISSKPLTIVTAFAIWVLAIILALPSALFSHVQPATTASNDTIYFCSPFPIEYGQQYKQTVVLCKFLAYYLGPLCVIACFYILMARHLELSTRNMPGELLGQSSQSRARKKVAKMVLSFVIIFIICFLPLHIFEMWYHFYPDSYDNYDNFWHFLRITGFCLSFINSCINPIALYFISGVFRKHFNRYLFCCCTSRRQLQHDVTLVPFNSTSCRRQHSVLTSHFTISQEEKT
ncbi:hypothetical protein M8J77_000419 [Diaphorina citri]|nr:hypothetical protein M8J77_000419 [Diaphorina citri]